MQKKKAQENISYCNTHSHVILLQQFVHGITLSSGLTYCRWCWLREGQQFWLSYCGIMEKFMDPLHHILELLVFPCHINSPQKKLRKESLNCAFSVLLKNTDIPPVKCSTYRRYAHIYSTEKGKYKNYMTMLHISALTFYHFRSLLTWSVCLCASSHHYMAKVSLTVMSLCHCWLHLDLLWNIKKGLNTSKMVWYTYIYYIHQFKKIWLLITLHRSVKYFSNLNQCPLQ